MHSIKNSFVVFLFLTVLAVHAQDKKNDSLNTAGLTGYKSQVISLEGQRKSDSVKKAALERKIEQLEGNDDVKKGALLLELQRLKGQDSVRLAEKKKGIDALRKSAVSYPVVAFIKDTLFTIYNRSGSFTARERAQAVSNRIEVLGDNINFSADSLKIVEEETTADLFYGQQIIISISEDDALWNNTDKLILAKSYKNEITTAIKKHKEATGFTVLLKEIGAAVLVLGFLIGLLFLMSRLFKWLAEKIKGQEGKRIAGIKLKTYTFFDSHQQVKVLLSLNTILKWVVFLVLIYVALPILFGIFPWTQDFAETLFGYILNPVRKIALGLWNYLPKLITIIVIVFVFRYLIKAMRFLKHEIEKGNLQISGFYPDWANPTYQILRILVFAFMVVVIFPYLPGSDSEIFKGVSVFLGFLFTFGSAGSLSNMIAGLVLTYMRLFKIGDRVKIGEVVGDVIEKSLLVTRVRTIKNEIVSIPNTTVMSSHTINYSSDTAGSGLIVHTTVTIGYDVPWKDISQALLNAADRTDLLLKDPKPFVLQTSLEDFYVAYQVNAYTKDANSQAAIYSQLHANIQDCCNEAGIEIMSPHYRAARDGNTSTIPPDYLPRDYKTPGFNIKADDKEHN